MGQDLEKQTTPSPPSDYQQTRGQEVSPVFVSGDNNEYITIGRQRVLRSELWSAFGGDLQPGVHATPDRRFANPAPLGLSGFAMTTFVLSMFNAQAMGITTPNVVVSLAVFYGGLIQLLAGMWEIALENTFGGTALSSYGGFWMSYAALFIPWFGIADAYDDPVEFGNAVGFFLLGWTLFTFMMLLVTMKSTVAFFLLFFFLELTFLMLAIGSFTAKVGVTRAGGVLGVITSFVSWYNAFAGLATKENSYVTVKAFALPGAKRV